MTVSSDSQECRLPNCTRMSNGDGTHRSSFCSSRCEVKYDHLKDDARDAERADREEAGEL